MKRSVVIILIITTLAACCACFAACNRASDDIDEGIYISFVTGFEDSDSPLIIDRIRTTYANPASLPEDPIRVGYKFLGWYYDRDYKKRFTINDEFTEDTTLYAKWEKKKSNSDVEKTSDEVDAPNGVRYSRNEDDTFTVIAYNGTATELTLPVSYEGKKIVSLAFKAFDGNSTLKSITLSDTITEVKDGAFFNCKSLEEINVSADNETFTSVDGALYRGRGTELVAVGQARKTKFEAVSPLANVVGYAFAGGTYEVELKSGRLTALNSLSFAYYAGKIVIGKNIKEIRQKAFYESTAEVSFSADCAIDKLAIGEFDGYKGEKLVIPSSVKSISGSPFNDATAEIDFSATGITELGESAFAGYKGETLFIPYFVKTIKSNAFYRCTSKITFDERSEYSCIEGYVFNNFRGEVTLPATVTEVKSYAFYAMPSATVRFALPKQDIKIAEDAFLYCPVGNDEIKIFYGK